MKTIKNNNFQGSAVFQTFILLLVFLIKPSFICHFETYEHFDNYYSIHFIDMRLNKKVLLNIDLYSWITKKTLRFSSIFFTNIYQYVNILQANFLCGAFTGSEGIGIYNYKKILNASSYVGYFLAHSVHLCLVLKLIISSKVHAPYTSHQKLK